MNQALLWFSSLDQNKQNNIILGAYIISDQNLDQNYSSNSSVSQTSHTSQISKSSTIISKKREKDIRVQNIISETKSMIKDRNF